MAEQNQPPTLNPLDMLQIGTIKESTGYSSMCGVSQIGIAVERDISGSITCDMFFGGFGSDYRFAVVKISSGWQAYVNGAKEDAPFDLGYSSGYSIARGEAYWASSPPTFSFTWGPSGETAWRTALTAGVAIRR